MAECIMAGNGFAACGEVYEIVEFIPAASYSMDAQIATKIPFDASAFYFGRISYMGTTVAQPNGNAADGYELRLTNVSIQGLNVAALNVNAVMLSFAENGATKGVLEYSARQGLASGAVNSSSPAAVTLGPVWMVRKI